MLQKASLVVLVLGQSAEQLPRFVQLHKSQWLVLPLQQVLSLHLSLFVLVLVPSLVV